MEDRAHRQPTGIEDKWQDVQRDRNNKHDTHDPARRRVEALFEKLRHGRDIARPVAGQKIPRHRDQCEHRHDLPRHHHRAVNGRRPVQTDELLGGKVGQQQRPGHLDPRQFPTGEEVGLRVTIILAAGLPP